jgi:hypothetical protein
MKVDEIGGERSTNGKDEKCITNNILARKPARKRQIGRPKHR